MINSLTERVSTSRSWAIGVGIGAALLAGLLLLLYLNRYRESVAGDNARSSVLVAKNLILEGTSGDVVATKQTYQVAEIQNKELKVGAVADPAYLNGRVATTDIYPGQQITTADFSSETTNAVDTQITGIERGISIELDNVHGSLSQLKAGDHIDVYVSLGAGNDGQALVKLFRPNITVLAVPAGGENDDGGNLILKVRQGDAADWAYAADNTQIYFVIRPNAGAKPTRPDTATVQNILNTNPRPR
jgi:Flp pilus assembly protein CpaB